jgi:antitoxin component of MazEF toxin-antitoxin module
MKKSENNMKVILEITSKGLYLPNTVLTQWGWREGTEVIIEPHDHTISIRAQRLTAEDISDIAGTYLFEKVGDAVATEAPVWDGEKWHVKVILPSFKKELGKLTFTANGQLLTTDSDSPTLLEKRANED